MLVITKKLSNTLAFVPRSQGDDLGRYWTMFLLTPSWVIDRPEQTLFHDTAGSNIQKLRSQPNKSSAELTCIGFALNNVLRRLGMVERAYL